MVRKLYCSFIRLRTTQYHVLFLFLFASMFLRSASSARQVQSSQEIFQIKDNKAVKPQILYINGFLIMGTLTRIKAGSESLEGFVSIWKNFELHHDQIKIHSTDRCYYGASFRVEQEDSIDYIAGMAVDSTTTASAGIVLRYVPGGLFAVFSCAVQNIGQTYRYIFGNWILSSGFEFSVTRVSFEKYPPVEDTASPVLIHIPVQQIKR